jgi:hypothetical protein
MSIQVSILERHITDPTQGGFEDQDYFLHPRNVEAFNQVIKNLHLACFWYSAPKMDVEECLERTRFHIAGNENLTQIGRTQLEEAVKHLETALSTPGWREWMTNGVSMPFEVGDTFSQRLRTAWSDSPDDPEVIDVKSLDILRRLNKKGMQEDQLVQEGYRNKLVKELAMLSELDKVEKKPRPKTKQGFADGLDGTILTTAANQPLQATAPPKPKRVRRTKQEILDERLVVAARNAEAQAIADEMERSELARPLPTTINSRSRSSKVNLVIERILSARAEDKFVIFGDNFELGHLTEALDLFDIKSYVHAGKDSADR